MNEENKFTQGLVKFKRDKVAIENSISQLKALANKLRSKNQVFKRFKLVQDKDDYYLILNEFDKTETAVFKLMPEQNEYLFEENPKMKILCRRFENAINFDKLTFVDKGRYLAGEKRPDDKFIEAKFYGDKMKERYVFRTVDFKKGGSSILFWKSAKKEPIGQFVNIETSMKSTAPATFDDKVNLPMSIEGELLREGEYYTGMISKDELFKAYQKLIGQNIILLASHDAYWSDKSNVNDVLGKLFDFEWDGEVGRILYKGEMYDEAAARKVLANLVNGISAGFDYDNDGSGYNKDLNIKEATLTFRPHCKTATVMAK